MKRLVVTLGFFLVVMVVNCNPSSAAPALNECTAMQPGWIFCSGFEEANWRSAWNDGDGNPDSTNLLMADPGPFNLSGNHTMRLRAPQVGSSASGADLVRNVSPPGYDALYARWYIRYEPGFDFNALNHGSGLLAGGFGLFGSGNRPQGNWYIATIEHESSLHNFFAYTYYRGMYQDCVNPNGSCWGDHFPCTLDEGTTAQSYCTKAQHREISTPAKPVAGRWYCVEMMMNGGTPTTTGSGANGQLTFSIHDGSQSLYNGSWNDLWLRTTSSVKVDTLWLQLYHHQQHSLEGVMFDNVVLSTQPIGCGDTTIPPNLPPTAPQNLRMQ